MDSRDIPAWSRPFTRATPGKPEPTSQRLWEPIGNQASLIEHLQDRVVRELKEKLVHLTRSKERDNQ
jgi:hypothetical protein